MTCHKDREVFFTPCVHAAFSSGVFNVHSGRLPQSESEEAFGPYPELNVFQCIQQRMIWKLLKTLLLSRLSFSV